MKQATKRIASMLIALVLLMGAFIFYFEAVAPAYGDMETLKGQAVSDASLLTQESSTVQLAQKLITTYQSESQAQSSVALAVPVGADISDALADLYGIAGTNSITIQDMSVSVAAVPPSAAVLSDASTTDATAASLVKPVGNISFTFTAAGSYENFKNFIGEAETNMRIFDVKGFAIQPASQNASSSQGDYFNYNVSVTAYYQTT
jgi:hypothetical protein